MRQLDSMYNEIFTDGRLKELFLIEFFNVLTMNSSCVSASVSDCDCLWTVNETNIDRW